MESIATYTETRFASQRTFTLFVDRIEIKAVNWGPSRAIQLATLCPFVFRRRSRHRLFPEGMLLIIAPWCFVALFGLPLDEPVESRWGAVATGMSLVGLLLAGVTARRHECALFLTLEGRPGLDIVKPAKDLENYEAFVSAVARQIGAVKRQAAPLGAPTVRPAMTQGDSHAAGGD